MKTSLTSTGRKLVYIGLSLYALLVIYPMIWLIGTSLKDSWSIFTKPWAFPSSPHWVNFYNAMDKGDLHIKFGISLGVVSVSLFFILLFSAMAAYALSRFRFKGNRPLYATFLSGMTIPVFLAAIPLFIMMKEMRISEDGKSLVDSLAGLTLVYISYSLSFTIFILHGFFKGLPGELAEAAAIDGCGPFRTFFQVMLPLAVPGLVTAAIFNAIGLWNEYPLALVLTTDTSRETLPLGIAALTTSQKYQADWGALFAGLTIGVLPTVIAYIFFQRHIQSGMTAGAVKG